MDTLWHLFPLWLEAWFWMGKLWSWFHCSQVSPQFGYAITNRIKAKRVKKQKERNVFFSPNNLFQMYVTRVTAREKAAVEAAGRWIGTSSLLKKTKGESTAQILVLTLLHGSASLVLVGFVTFTQCLCLVPLLSKRPYSSKRAVVSSIKATVSSIPVS